jgi:hypothetical protein
MALISNLLYNEANYAIRTNYFNHTLNEEEINQKNIDTSIMIF